jgi:hypothetical protein
MTSNTTTKARAHRPSLRVPALLLGALVVAGLAAVGAEGGVGGDSAGGDPTVGTLPMTGGEGVDLDQTVTLRGATEAVRAAILAAEGEGGVEVIDLGSGDSWVRFYGDVALRLDVAALSELQVGIFGGFEGGGAAFAIETAGGMGSPFGLECGYSLDVEVDRLLSEGLIYDPLSVHAFHRSGRRTSTALQLDGTGQVLTVRQSL